MTTKIEWTDETWNPTVGCRRVSAGCEHCYAETVARRGMSPQHRNLTDKKGRWNGRVSLVPHRLTEPVRWRRPRLVFVDSMSDLFFNEISDDFVRAVFGAMIAKRLTKPSDGTAPGRSPHTFQVLTKRPRRLQLFMFAEKSEECALSFLRWTEKLERPAHIDFDPCWPPSNVWLGVSVEDQRSADERVPILRETDAALRFLSCEPLLGPVELNLEGIHWVIVGGESGHDARPCDIRWVEDILEQCRRACVPCFVKQLGAHVFDGDRTWWEEQGGDLVEEGPCGISTYGNAVRLRDPKGGEMKMWPHALQVREMP